METDSCYSIPFSFAVCCCCFCCSVFLVHVAATTNSAIVGENFSLNLCFAGCLPFAVRFVGGGPLLLLFVYFTIEFETVLMFVFLGSFRLFFCPLSLE